ncbi:MAG: alpha/beta hydrolase [Candidatus Caldarchaeum sp.]|nr:alpha/beta hydrolase [Candidatus Caldarchaeum sp.]
MFVAGNPKNPPLVLVPALFVSLDVFLLTIPRMVSDFYVVSYDKPGRGYSEKAMRPQTISDLADHLATLVNQLLPGTRPLLSGSGFGGWVAARAASKYPDRFKALILNNPGNPKPQAIETLRRANHEEVERGTLEASKKSFERLVSSPEFALMDLVCIRYATHALEGNVVLAKQNIDNCLHAFTVPDDSWEKDWVKGIRLPTLLLWSKGNRIDDFTDYRPILDQIPGIEVRILEGGMFPHLERPEEFAQIHREFMGRVEQAWPYETEKNT